MKKVIFVFGVFVLLNLFSAEPKVQAAPQAQNDSLSTWLKRYGELEKKVDALQEQAAEIDSLIAILNEKEKETWLITRKKSRLFAKKADLTEELDSLKRKQNNLRVKINLKLEPLFIKSTERMYDLIAQIKTSADSAEVGSLYVEMLKLKRGRDVLVAYYKDVNKDAEMTKSIRRRPEISSEVFEKYPWLVKKTEQYLRNKLQETENLYQAAFEEWQLHQRIEELGLEMNVLSEPDFISPSQSTEKTSPMSYNNGYYQYNSYDYYLGENSRGIQLPSSLSDLNLDMRVFLYDFDNMGEYIIHLDSLRAYYRDELRKIHEIEQK